MASKTEKLAIPRSLKMVVIKIQAKQDMDWDKACEHLAELSELNSKKFKQAVNREANRRYKSRYLAELNKAKKTFEDKGYSKGEIIGQKIGYALGHDKAKREYRISYPCSVCGKPCYMKPNGSSAKVAGEYLTNEKWGHVSCNK